MDLGLLALVPRNLYKDKNAKGLKEELLADITIFRNSAQWYHDRGVPYRRGYLLHGPPGTGKTSFTTALAGHLCIILLVEDVDAALLGRKPGEDQAGSNNVTLSGILNSLDGITAQQGNKHQIKGMFLKFFLNRSLNGQAGNELKSAACLTSSSTSYDLINTAELDHDEQARKEGYDAMIYKIPDQVSEMITYEDSVSTAQLQEFFMLHRNEPETILDKMPGFLNELARERRGPLGKGEAKKADNKEEDKKK
ncbi:mitochondrial chaperone [Entomortierella lignicola]|nr:mitochondrial chaperone [Entomortierella lignicola]